MEASVGGGRAEGRTHSILSLLANEWPRKHFTDASSLFHILIYSTLNHYMDLSIHRLGKGMSFPFYIRMGESRKDLGGILSSENCIKMVKKNSLKAARKNIKN